MDEREKGKMLNQIKRISVMEDPTFDVLIDTLKQNNDKEVIDAFIHLKQEMKML